MSALGSRGFNLVGFEAGHRVEQALLFAAIEIVRGHGGDNRVVKLDDKFLLRLLATEFHDRRGPACERNLGEIG